MSRFIDKLQDVSEGGGHQPLGFAPRSRELIPSLLTIPYLSAPSPDALAAAVEAGADALLLSLGDGTQGVQALDALPELVGSVPWGVSLDAPTGETVQALKEKGCDYLVFPLGGTPLSILRDEEIGKVLMVDSNLEERLAHGIEQLAVDAALASVDAQGPLTLDHLLEYLYLFSLTGLPLLITLPHQWATGDLEELRDDGVSGLVVPFAGPEQVEEVRRLKEVIASLAPRSRRREGLQPRLPYLSVHQAEEEPDIDDE